MVDKKDDKKTMTREEQQAKEDQQGPPITQLDSFLPIDDHEEEVSINGKKVTRKGVYILPNLFTTGALFAGFYAVVSAMHGQFEDAAIAIFVAMVLDIFDGRIARLTNTQSAFGAEYDSLSDMVSFGLAPALVVLSWSLHEVGKFGWAAAFIYVACAALRLARFNAQQETSDKRYFTGLASPAAAAALAAMVWVSHDLGWMGENLPEFLPPLMAVATAVIGLLMVSNIRYQSFKSVDLKARVPFIVMIMMIAVFAVIVIDPPTVLLAMLAVYILSGPLLHFRVKSQQADKD